MYIRFFLFHEEEMKIRIGVCQGYREEVTSCDKSTTWTKFKYMKWRRILWSPFKVYCLNIDCGEKERIVSDRGDEKGNVFYVLRELHLKFWKENQKVNIWLIMFIFLVPQLADLFYSCFKKVTFTQRFSIISSQSMHIIMNLKKSTRE